MTPAAALEALPLFIVDSFRILFFYLFNFMAID